MTLRLEEEYVHNVYDAIASEFSTTRYKAWPAVDSFLKSQPANSFGADVGYEACIIYSSCGNGKYIGHCKKCDNNIFMLGSDRSSGLLDICSKRGFEVGLFDTCILPYRDSVFVSSIYTYA